MIAKASNRTSCAEKKDSHSNVCGKDFYCSKRGRCTSRACMCTPGEMISGDQPAFKLDDAHACRGNDDATLVTSSFSRKVSDSVFWFHVPKAGSSFLTTIFHWACPRVPPDVALVEGATRNFLHRHWQQWAWCDVLFTDTVPGHSPYIRSRDKGRAVGLFRRPQQRIMSAYLSGLHHYGMRDFRTMQKVVRDRASTDVESALRMYVEWPGISGCQTKMVLGKTCASSYRLRPRDLVEAKRIVRDEFLFVGLTDQFDRSVCLFHAMLGGTVQTNEFVNMRRTTKVLDRFNKNSQRFENASRIKHDGLVSNVVDASRSFASNSRFRRIRSELRTTGDADTKTENIFKKLTNGSYDERVLRKIGYRDEYDEALFAFVEHIFETRAAMYDLGDCMRFARK